MVLIWGLIFFFAQSTYYGPERPHPPGFPPLIRVEVLIYDESTQGGLQIEEVSFNGQSIALKPRDVRFFRGGGSFQVPPGTYLVEWSAKRDRYVWPRSVSFSRKVTINPRDLWIQLVVQGDQLELQ